MEKKDMHFDRFHLLSQFFCLSDSITVVWSLLYYYYYYLDDTRTSRFVCL